MVFFSCCYERGSSFPAGASVPAGASQISYFKILPWKPKETSSFRDEDIQNKITAVMAGGIPIGYFQSRGHLVATVFQLKLPKGLGREVKNWFSR